MSLLTPGDGLFASAVALPIAAGISTHRTRKSVYHGLPGKVGDEKEEFLSEVLSELDEGVLVRGGDSTATGSSTSTGGRPRSEKGRLL